MKLHDFAFSPNSRKVRAVAYELGVKLEYVHVDLVKGESRTPAFLELNPNGRVPVLEDGDFVLWESTAIIRYLAAKSDRPAALVPSNARGVADVDRWLAWQCAHLSPAISKVAFERIVKKLTGQGEPDAAAIRAGTADPKQLPGSFAGRDFDNAMLSELPGSVDPCGERGEFHTFAHDGPMFRRPVSVRSGEVVERDGFVFADLFLER